MIPVTVKIPIIKNERTVKNVFLISSTFIKHSSQKQINGCVDYIFTAYGYLNFSAN